MQTFNTVTTKELRNNLAEVLEQVAIGKKSFVVSKFGKKKALLIPFEQDQKLTSSQLSKHPARGIWKNRTDIESSGKWVAKIRLSQSKRV